MTTRLDIDGEGRTLTAPAGLTDGGVLRWEEDGAPREVTLRRVGPHEWVARQDGRQTRLWTARTGEGTWVSWGGRTRLVRDVTREARRVSGARGGGGRVTPPTPATVVSVLVAPGDTVAAGAPLVVVSAMKMETTLAAPAAARVVAVDTAVGARVMPGDELVALEPLPDGDVDGEAEATGPAPRGERP